MVVQQLELGVFLFWERFGQVGSTGRPPQLTRVVSVPKTSHLPHFPLITCPSLPMSMYALVGFGLIKAFIGHFLGNLFYLTIKV